MSRDTTVIVNDGNGSVNQMLFFMKNNIFSYSGC